MPLTIKTIDAAQPASKGYKLADAHGLYLYILPSGGKSWRANYKTDAKQRTRTYGTYPGVSLAQARKCHAAAKVLPQTAPKPTFTAIAQQWLKIKLPTLSNVKHQGQVAETLERYVFPAIGQKAVDTITRADLVSVVRAIDTDGKTETAHRVAGRISMVLDYAVDCGVIDLHPSSGLSRVLTARTVQKHMASIPPADTGKLMRAIQSYPEPITRLGLLFLAHTFVRVGELRGMRWAELQGDVWVIPEARMKGRKPHVVPLSGPALQVLAELRVQTGEFELVFDSAVRPGHPMSENTFLFALYRLGYRGLMTAHGFRSLASTVLNEQSGFSSEVIERQLAHRETDAVRAAYNRAEYLPQRVLLMAWWSDWLVAQSLAGQTVASACYP